MVVDGRVSENWCLRLREVFFKFPFATLNFAMNGTVDTNDPSSGFFLKDMRFLELWRPMHGTTTRRLPSIEKFLSCQLVITLICNITRAHILRLPRHQAETNEVIIIIFWYDRNKSRIARQKLHFTLRFVSF